VLLVWRSAYAVRLPFTRLRLAETGVPRRGDVIVFEGPRHPGTDYVKRVVGVPGDVVELREQVLHLNGVPQPRTPAGEYAVAEEGRSAGEPGASRRRRGHTSLR
jgi:signal peptidase I